MVDSERAGQTLLENDPNSKYPKCQVFDLSIESNALPLHAWLHHWILAGIDYVNRGFWCSK